MKLSTFAAALLAVLAQQATAADCTREELKGTVDAYFAALSAHSTKGLPLAANVRFTENGAVTRPGEGFWKTAGKLVFSRNALDSQTCSTATQVIIEEDGKNIIFGVRLKLDEAKKISEIEHIIAREKDFAFKPQGILDTRDQDWETILPPEQRTSRAAMVAAANDYYDMFVAVPEVSVPFAKPCERWENGTKTTRGDCSPKGLTIVHEHRRVPVVDREAGIAVAFVFFAGGLPDFHMFKFRSGHLELAQAVIGAKAANDIGWPDDTTLSHRTAPKGEQMSRPLGVGGANPQQPGQAQPAAATPAPTK